MPPFFTSAISTSIIGKYSSELIAIFILDSAEFLGYFVKELEQDLNNENGGAMILVWSCFDAGRLNQKLFNERDPFASNRHLEPSNFVVDRLMAAREQYGQFCNIFLSQLKEEM